MANRAVFDAICEDVAGGMLVSAACEKHGVDRSTVWRWCADDEELRTAYARVRGMQIESMADEIMQISDDAPTSSEGIQKARLRVDTRKFLMAKIAPRIYGDKLDVTSDGMPLGLSGLLAGTFPKKFTDE